LSCTDHGEINTGRTREPRKKDWGKLLTDKELHVSFLKSNVGENRHGHQSNWSIRRDGQRMDGQHPYRLFDG
jgi:hypothetical protein